MKKQQNNSTSASAIQIVLSIALLSISAVLMASSFKAAPPAPSTVSAPSDLAWSIVASPNNGTSSNYLNGVTCASASDCWAVGYAFSVSLLNYQTLIEHWNGTSWSIVASPNTGTLQNVLRGVTCASASDCWAVGDYWNGGAFQTLIEHWNGTSWSIVTSPNTGTFGDALFGVTCASAADCWAVGNSDPQTLIEHWDGTSWSIVTSPNTGTGDNILNGVTCASASDCWAVGTVSDAGQTLIEHWDGTSWSIVTSPNGTAFTGVTCASASDCWAVGWGPRTLTEHWDGTSWSIVTSPNNGTFDNRLFGVTCASASDCTSVGWYVNDARSSRP